MKMSCVHADTCLPDFWSGHHLPHVSIPVHNGMSFKAVREEIIAELRHGFVMGNSEDAELMRFDLVSPDKEARADALTRAAYAAVNRDVKPAKKGARNAFPDLEPDLEPDSDEVYAYFVFVTEE